MFILSVTLLTAVYATVAADFACICNYNVEQIVYTTPNTNGKLLGYMYEFDCKPAATDANPPGYVQIYFEHKIGYVERGAGVETQTCPGSIPDSDVLITNIQTTTTTTTTPIPTTTTSTTTTSTPIPTTTSTTSTTPIPTTATTTTTTPRPTTTTTTTTTPAPTTTTTITTTPRPTTTATTTNTPKPTTTTSTTTLKPVTTTTATTTSRPDTSSSTTTTTPKPTTTSSTTPMPTASPDCRHDKADIVFLLDSSFSVGIDNFKKQLQFVRNFTTNYDIGPDKVQVGVVTFATTPTLGFHLNQYNDTTSLLIAIDGVNYTSGGSSTDMALEYVRENSFTDAHGARAGVPQILVFITDGPSYFPIGTSNEARILHFRNIKTIAIGVGSEVAMTELNQIGSDAQKVFTVLSFDSLQSIEMDIQSAACGFENIDQTSCESKLADIVFILDSSGSEGKTNFEKQLQFVSNVTNSFDIGPNKTQVSVVTSGTHAYNAFFLNEYSDKASLQTAIHYISYQGGTSNTADELNFVNTNSFKPLNGGRGGAVTKLLVILTDGKSISVDATHTAAQSLKLRGIKVISVGIGSNVSMTELRQIASDSSHVLSVTDFNALNTISHEIERLACMAPSPCGDNPADIVFLLDDSSSQGADNFQKQLDFITNFVNQFDIGPTDVQVGLLTFGTTAHNEFYFNSYSDKPSLIGAIQSVQYRGGSTATNFALRYAHYYQFAAYNGARVNAARIVIIMTDGHSNDASLTISEAMSLKNSMHAQVIAIGIGAGVNQLELNDMATDRSHVFIIGNFSILHTLQTEIKEQACGVPKPKQVASTACGKQPADIVFLLDSSASEGYDNFQKQLDFVRDFVYQFTIGPHDVQVSVIVFSNNSHEQFPLNRYHNRVDLLNAIARITYNNGGTYTNEALHMARTESFLASKGARPNAHIVILLTAGHSIHPAVTAREADLLKNQTNMNVIAIGIGSGVNRSELHRIASNNAQALFIADFNSLSAFQSELTFMACKTCTFANKADIVFALDASSSEGALNFHSQLDFVSRVASDFTVGVHNVQIGIVTFSDSSHLEFNLNQYHDKSSLLAAIQKVAYTQGITTHTDEALEFIRQRMFKLAAGDRDHANNYVILITDGASNNRNATIQAANLLKQQNVIFIVIGIGSNINSAELNTIASDPRHLFLVSDFNALRALSEDIKAVACEEVQSTTAASPIHATATVG